MARNLPYYWVRENAIPHELCDMIVAERQTLIEKAAGVGLNNQAPPDNLRKTSVAWADRNHWLEGILLNNAHYANREAGWNIDVSSHYNEQVQLAKYETGHFYDWHKDTFFLTTAETCRKLTSLALLNDHSEFSGGDFQLQNVRETINLKKGSVIVFPSYLDHRATEVTSGTRYSAALWIHGPNFR